MLSIPIEIFPSWRSKRWQGRRISNLNGGFVSRSLLQQQLTMCFSGAECSSSIPLRLPNWPD